MKYVIYPFQDGFIFDLFVRTENKMLLIEKSLNYLIKMIDFFLENSLSQGFDRINWHIKDLEIYIVLFT